MSKNNREKSGNAFSFGGKRFRNGSYSATMIVIVIAIVIILNLVVSKIPSKYLELDISGNKLYTISEQTEKKLASLEEDVNIYYLISDTAKENYPELTKLLEKCAESSKHITLSVKDPDLYPTFGNKYEATSTTAVIVESDKRYELLDINDIYTISNYSDYYSGYADAEYAFAGENIVVNAVDYVTTNSLPTIYNLVGEGEAVLDSDIEAMITDTHITINDLDMLANNEIPKDCDCLLINAPTDDFNSITTKAILSYLENGGQAMIIVGDMDVKDMPNFISILEAYGVTIEDGIVYEGAGDYINQGNPTSIIPDIISTDITLDMVSAGARVLMTNSHSIKELEENRDTLKIDSLLTTSESSYLKKQDSNNGDNYEKQDGDAEGPFDVAVAISDSEANAETEEGTSTEEEDAEKEAVETRLVVFGSSAIVDSGIYNGVTKNDAYMFAYAIGWMCNYEDSISISAKSLTEESLVITDGQVNLWMTVYLLIPAAIIAVGVGVTVYRRRR